MVIDLTETEEYRSQMTEAIEASGEWFDKLGYADADFKMKAWMIWHRGRHDNAEKCSYPGTV